MTAAPGSSCDRRAGQLKYPPHHGWRRRRARPLAIPRAALPRAALLARLPGRGRFDKGLLHGTARPGCLRIWFDAASAGDLLFFEPMLERLGRRHETACTVSADPAVQAVARARGLGVRRAGRRGGRAARGQASRHARLASRISRVGPLAREASRFSPDLAVSFSSAEAARAAYGLGIDHVCFCDDTGDDELVRLVAPLVQKMILPWHAPAAPVVRRGLDAGSVHRSTWTVAATTSRRRPAGARRTRGGRGGPPPRGAVLVRPPSERAAGSAAASAEWARQVAGALAEARRNAGAVPAAILARSGQAGALRAALGRSARIVAEGEHDGMLLLGRCGALVGHGGSTMAAEAALSGVPAVSYGGRQGAAEARLARAGLVARARSAGGLRSRIQAALDGGADARAGLRARAGAEISAMDDPFAALAEAAGSLGLRL